MAPIHPQLAQAFALAQAGRLPEALAIIDQRAALGDADALFTLADVHWRGQMVPRDFARAQALFGRASAAGHPIAIRAYTNLLAHGAVSPRDWPRAIARLRVEALQDTRRAHMLRLIEAMDLTEVGDPRSLPEPERLSESPDVVRIPRLFTPDECDFLMLVAEPTFEPSLVGGESGRDYRDPVRTSDGAPMHWLIEDPAIHALNRRLAAASGTRVEQGEPLLILRYRPGQQYRPHCDALPGVANQRFRTALVYLNTDYEGGETAFVKTGLTIKGAKGDAIVFGNTLPGGRTDPMSEHAGLPVTRGTKYLASRWIRERRHAPDVSTA